DAPAALARLVHRLLSKDASARPASAAAVAEELARIKPDRPRSWAAWAVGVAAVLVGVLLCGWVIIKITHKDGSQTTLKVPPDTEVEIDKDGKVGVKLADGGKKPEKKDDTPKPVPDRGAPKATKGFVTSLDVSRDGKHLLFAATDGHVHWWDIV